MSELLVVVTFVGLVVASEALIRLLARITIGGGR